MLIAQTDDFAVVEVQNTGEIKPTLVSENISDIGKLDLVESGRDGKQR